MAKSYKNWDSPYKYLKTQGNKLVFASYDAAGNIQGYSFAYTKYTSSYTSLGTTAFYSYDSLNNDKHWSYSYTSSAVAMPQTTVTGSASWKQGWSYAYAYGNT